MFTSILMFTCCSTAPPLLLLLHLSPPSVHLLLSNCSRNLSFISITCRKPAEPKIAPVLQAFLYRPIFPVLFSLESLWPSPCLFLQCPSLISTSPQTQCQKQLLDLIVFLKVLVMKYGICGWEFIFRNSHPHLKWSQKQKIKVGTWPHTNTSLGNYPIIPNLLIMH